MLAYLEDLHKLGILQPGRGLGFAREACEFADATCRKLGRAGYWPYIAFIVGPAALLLSTNYMRRSLLCHATDALKPV
jgi:hypothetical protein